MTIRRKIGEWRGVCFEVAEWDGAGADVDMSFACMFTHEVAVDGPAGGLLHLDRTLSGALTELRSSGNFRADQMETLLVRTPPAPISAKTVAVIGLGDPAAWTSTVTARAVATGMRMAGQHGATSAAFAPSLKDAGLGQSPASEFEVIMLKAAIEAINSEARIAELGLAPEVSVRRWAFDAGAAHFDGTADRFEAAFAIYQSKKELKRPTMF